MEPFQYHPLDNARKEFRLISFAHKPDDKRPIEIELLHCSLLDPGEYYPLSYVSGNAADRELIIINGASKEVPRSVVSLLRAAWRVFPDDSTKNLWWADAICINQEDKVEKSHQVQLMRSIYKNGSSTFGFLGPSEDAHLVKEHLETISTDWAYQCREAMGPNWRNQDPDPNFGDWMGRHRKFWEKNCEEMVPNRYWNALKKLLELPYWSRLWIYQELVLPPRFGIIYGSVAFQLPILLSTFYWYSAIRKRTRALFEGLIDYSLWRCFLTGWHLKFHVIWRLEHGRMLHRHHKQKIDLELVYVCSDLQATDPRDKIFGLLGVMHTKLIPDYTKSARDVYCEFVCAWESEAGSLSILNFAGLNFRLDDRSELQLPSWVPDWQDIAKTGREGRLHQLLGFGGDAYRASLGLHRTLVRYSSPWSALFVSGVICDEVIEIIPEWSSDYDATSLLNWIEEFMQKGATIERGSGIPIFQVIFRTMFKDILIPPNVRIDINSSEAHLLFTRFLFVLLSKEFRTIGPDATLQKHLPRLGLHSGAEFGECYKQNIFPNAETIPTLPDWRDAKTALSNQEIAKEDQLFEVLTEVTAFSNRRMFVTRLGYLGLAISLQKEDLVAVISGCNVPVLLRKQDNHYVLVGVCFVLGLMDGEAKGKVDRGEAKNEELEIH